MTNIAIELKDLCTLVDWPMMGQVAGGETVTVRPDGAVIFDHTDLQGQKHELTLGQLTPEQYTKVALP